MTWPPRFLFHSGRLCLDLAHTGGEGKYAVFERLGKPTDLADWLAASSLGLRVERVRSEELGAARALRSAIWNGAQALLAGRELPRGVCAALNEAAARRDLVPRLASDGVRWAPGSTAAQALASIARDAVSLFGSDAIQRLRECRHPRCPLLFVDASRPGRRVWCSMERCGNLTKTTRYRSQHRRATPRRSPAT